MDGALFLFEEYNFDTIGTVICSLKLHMKMVLIYF